MKLKSIKFKFRARFSSEALKEIASRTGRASLLRSDKIGEIHDDFTMNEFGKKPLRLF